jgi:spore coat protein U-like protein
VRRVCVIACLAAASLAPATTRAATCTFSTGGVDFGAYSLLATAPLKAPGRIDYACKGTPAITRAYVTMSAGSSSNAGARTMTNGPERLGYNIYLDAALTTIWGDGGAYQGVWLNYPVTGFVPFYGSIPPGQDVAAGAYADTLTITVDLF